jgi:hypothetical protein
MEHITIPAPAGKDTLLQAVIRTGSTASELANSPLTCITWSRGPDGWEVIARLDMAPWEDLEGHHEC